MTQYDFKIEPEWKESKEAIWAREFAHLTAQPQEKSSLRSPRSFFQWGIVSVAALFLLLMGWYGFTYFYRQNVRVLPGEFQTLLLPDGSSVEMNADSRISYKPYWWKKERVVVMEGECFFQVKKGSAFTVQTRLGSVQVLGTSFNVYERGLHFSVSCYTGKVNVEYAKSRQVLLPNMRLNINRGKVKQSVFGGDCGIPDWKVGRFVFEDTPLQEVIEAIERHYGVQVELQDVSPYLYTGTFAIPATPNEALEILEQTYRLNLPILK